jgi:hypothetical protein
VLVLNARVVPYRGKAVLAHMGSRKLGQRRLEVNIAKADPSTPMYTPIRTPKYQNPLFHITHCLFVKMRILFLLAPLLLGSVLAESNPNVNKREDKNDDCTFYANTSIALINISWPKNTMVRRRVVYETTKKLDRYDQTMWDHGWKWAEGQEESKFVHRFCSMFVQPETAILQSGRFS